MEVRYATKKLERQCTVERAMKKAFDMGVVKALKLRINELHSVESFADLFHTTGRWEQLSGNLAGEWSARLSANYRLIVEPIGDGQDPTGLRIVEVQDIRDYH